MANKRINPILWIGLIGTLTIGTSFITDAYRAFRGDHRIWWTPHAMMLPVEETRGNFEIYIGGKPLQKHLSDGTLFSVDKNGKQYPIVSKDIAVRLNNWDKIKASILGHTTMSGFAFGVAITLLVIGLIQSFNHGKQSR
jgi:hypothetical protein